MKDRKPSPRKRSSSKLEKHSPSSSRSRSPRGTVPVDLSTYFNARLDLLCILDVEGCLLKANPELEALMGRAPGELTGKYFLDFFHADDRPATLASFGEVVAERDVPALVNRILTRDGTYRLLEWKAARQGEYVYASARDMTDRKQAEDALRESRRMLETVLDTIPVRVFWKDLSSKYLGCNRPFARDAGFSSPAELIGRDDYQMGWVEQADLYRSDDRAVMDTGREKIGYEEPQTQADGKHIWLRTSKVPLRGLEGDIRGVLGTYEDITEQKTAEKALRESEERYHRITRTTTDYIYHVRVDGEKAVETYHGRRCLSVTGYNPQEFAADKDLWWRMVDPEDRPLVEDQARRILSGTDAPAIEHRLWRKDGIRRWVRNTPVLYHDSRGRLLSYDGLIQDITERKETELRIRAQHDLALALSATTDIKEGLRLCLDTAMRVSGMEAGGVYIVDLQTGAMDLAVHHGLGPDILAVVGHLEADASEALWMMEGQPIYTDYQGLKPHMDPIPKPYEQLRTLVSIPIRHEQKIIGCLNLVSTTVTVIPPSVRDMLETIVAQIGNAIARLRSEAALRESQQMLKTVLNTIPARVFWKDRSLVYMGCNRAFAQDCGMESPEKIIGLDDYAFSREDLAKGYQSDDREVMQTGTAKLNYEEMLVHPAGDEFWGSTSKIPLRDAEGNIRGVLGTYEDITERRKAEEEIRTLNAELEQRVMQRTAQLEAANKELEAFSFSVSHDLRAPLRALDGFTRALEEDYGKILDDEGRRLCAIIRRNTRHMYDLIDDLLALSRLNRTAMEHLTTDTTSMVQSVYQELTTPGDRARIDFHVGSLAKVTADPILLRQVWTNLISNALKFSAKRDRAQIQVDCRSEGDEDVFSIRDNGAGFDMQFADRLFGVFQRLHNSSEFEGTGVGLAIVQRIVHRHGGRVWARGEPERGATFYFSLPRAKDPPGR